MLFWHSSSRPTFIFLWPKPDSLHCVLQMCSSGKRTVYWKQVILTPALPCGNPGEKSTTGWKWKKQWQAHFVSLNFNFRGCGEQAQATVAVRQPAISHFQNKPMCCLGTPQLRLSLMKCWGQNAWSTSAKLVYLTQTPPHCFFVSRQWQFRSLLVVLMYFGFFSNRI